MWFGLSYRRIGNLVNEGSAQGVGLIHARPSVCGLLERILGYEVAKSLEIERLEINVLGHPFRAKAGHAAEIAARAGKLRRLGFGGLLRRAGLFFDRGGLAHGFIRR